MSDHIPDATKMISDTPRMQSALLDHPEAGFAKIWQVGCDIERELNTARKRIKRLEEAGDEMYKFINPPSPCMRTSRMDNLLQDWDDAKININ